MEGRREGDWTAHLDPVDVGRDAEARGPAQGVEDVTLGGVAAAALQLLHVGSGGGQHAQDPPQHQEVVLQRAGLLRHTSHKRSSVWQQCPFKHHKYEEEVFDKESIYF